MRHLAAVMSRAAATSVTSRRTRTSLRAAAAAADGGDTQQQQQPLLTQQQSQQQGINPYGAYGSGGGDADAGGATAGSSGALVPLGGGGGGGAAAPPLRAFEYVRDAWLRAAADPAVRAHWREAERLMKESGPAGGGSGMWCGVRSGAAGCVAGQRAVVRGSGMCSGAAGCVAGSEVAQLTGAGAGAGRVYDRPLRPARCGTALYTRAHNLTAPSTPSLALF